MLISKLDADVLLLEALNVTIDLPALFGLVDSELSAQSALTLLSLTMKFSLSLNMGLTLSLNMGLALGLAVDLAQKVIDLAKEVVEGRILWALRPRA
jgi:hypothetical protein